MLSPVSLSMLMPAPMPMVSPGLSPLVIANPVSVGGPVRPTVQISVLRPVDLTVANRVVIAVAIPISSSMLRRRRLSGASAWSEDAHALP